MKLIIVGSPDRGYCDAKGNKLADGTKIWEIAKHTDPSDVFYCNHKGGPCHRMEPAYEPDGSFAGKWFCPLGHGPERKSR